MIMKRCFLGISPLPQSPTLCERVCFIPDFSAEESILIHDDVMPNSMHLASDPRNAVVFGRLAPDIGKDTSIIDTSELTDEQLAASVDSFGDLGTMQERLRVN